MGKKYIRIEKGTNEEMYPKTIAEQVVVDKFPSLKENLEDIENRLKIAEAPTISKKSKSNSIDIELHVGEKHTIANIPVYSPESSETVGLIDEYIYEDIYTAKDVDIPNLKKDKLNKTEADNTFVKKATLAKTTGNSEDVPMTQKATTDEIKIRDNEYNLSSSRYGGQKHTLQEAVTLISLTLTDIELQNTGLKIIFIDKETNEVMTYVYKGNRATPSEFSNVEKWEKLIANVYVDNEDLTQVKDASGKDVLRFANRGTLNGMGYKILRKKNGSYTLSQADFNGSDGQPLTNTIFVFQYDFSLSGDITIGEGCVLKFEGGSFNGGEISFSTPTSIIANYKIFYNVQLARNSYFANDFINPSWFGVVGDGFADDTISIKYMFNFIKNIKNEIYTFRNLSSSSPTIQFLPHRYKITEPILIDTKCNTIGFPVFVFDGAYVKNSAVITLDNQYSNWHNFSVTRTFKSGINIDSTNNFSAVKIKGAHSCAINVDSIYGFQNGIYIDSVGHNVCAASYIHPRTINYCINAIVVSSKEKGWPNANKIYGCEFNGHSDLNTTSEDIKYGSFVKFISDGTYGANSIDFENCLIESQLSKIKPIHIFTFTNNGINNIDYGDILIHNFRIEDTNGYILWSDKKVSFRKIEMYRFMSNFLNLNKVKLGDYEYELNDNILKLFGIKYDNTRLNYGIEFTKDSILNKLSKDGEYYNIDKYIHFVNIYKNNPKILVLKSIDNFGGYPTYGVLLKPNQTLVFSKKTKSTKGLSVCIRNNEGSPIDFPSDVDYDTSDTYLSPSTQYYVSQITTKSELFDSFYIKNNGGNTYQIFSLCFLDYSISSSMEIELVENPNKLNILGAIAEKPILDSECVGFKYYANDTFKEITYTGSKWVDAVGQDV